MTLLQKLWAFAGHLTRGSAMSSTVPEERDVEALGPELSRWETFGTHQYRQPGEEVSVVFRNPSLGVRRTIVNESGRILHFPGIAPAATERVDTARLDARVRFRTDFVRMADGNILMLWQVQPDGRYWGDEDGFGMENDPEIILCSRLNERGRFCGPFELYSIGRKRYFEYTAPTAEAK